MAKPRKGDDNDVVRNRGEGTYLLKQIQAQIRLAGRAGEVEEYVREAGGKMAVSDLERAIRKGLLGLLIKVFKRNDITIRGF